MLHNPDLTSKPTIFDLNIEYMQQPDHLDSFLPLLAPRLATDFVTTQAQKLASPESGELSAPLQRSPETLTNRNGNSPIRRYTVVPKCLSPTSYPNPTHTHTNPYTLHPLLGGSWIVIRRVISPLT